MNQEERLSRIIQYLHNAGLTETETRVIVHQVWEIALQTVQEELTREQEQTPVCIQ